jgi:hypothetical protein
MKTKLKLYLFILTFLLAPKLQAQVVFNKIIEDTIGHVMNSVVALDTGYVFLSGTGNEYDVRSFALTFVNEVGEKQWKHIYGDPVAEYWEGWDGNMKNYGNTYEFAGEYVNPSEGKRGIHLNIFDENYNLSSQEIIFYDTIDKRAFYSIKFLEDDSYYITGQLYDYEDNTYRLLLLKADSSGNYIWHKSYSGEYALGSFLLETSEHNVLVGGARSYPIGINNRKWYLLKTDTAGNVIWEQAYGRNNYNNGKVSGLIETQDSNYLVSGSYPAANYGGGTGVTLYDGCLRKVDTAGELLWEKHYRNYSCHSDDPSDIDIKSSINSIFQENNGDLLILGSAFGYYPIHRGFLMKTNFKGQIKWHKYYYAVSVSSRWQYFSDFKPTNDDGYILGGYGNDYSNLGYDPPQQAWLVKTDSLGMDGLSNVEPDALQLEVDLPSPACNNDTLQIYVNIAGKSAPYTLEFSTGQVIDSIYYPPTFVPQEIGLDTIELEWDGSVYLNDKIREATITNHEWGHCIVKPIEFYTPSESGHYNVEITLTDAYGESITITRGINIDDCPNTIAETETTSACSIYPNPATDKLHLQLPNLTQTQQAKIYDAGGKLVFTQSISTKTTTLDISNLKPGNYILKIDGISKGFTVVK